MKRILFIPIIFFVLQSFSQVVTPIYGDSVKLKQNGNRPTELIIENSTKSIDGFLKNVSNGRTKFVPAVDSVYVDGSLLKLRRGGSWISIPFLQADSVNGFAVRSVSDLRATDYFAIAARKKSSNDKIKVTTLGVNSVGDGGGGDWYYDLASTETDNTGTVVKPTSVSGAGRWKRTLTNRTINAKWFGIKANGYEDNRARLINALSAASKMSNEFDNTYNYGTLYIPADSGYYYISDSINLPGNVHIVGDYGHYPTYGTRILSATNKPGFIARNNSPGLGAGPTGVRAWRMDNIMISKDNTYGDTTSTAGLWTNIRCELNNVAVFYFGGNGIEINTQYGGNTNSSIINDCQVVGNKKNGIFFRGLEASNCYVTNLLAINNGYWGIQDSGFLGNNVYNLHTEQNGVRADITDNSCTYGGKSYYCSRNNVGIEPTVTPGWENYWYQTTGGVYGGAWTALRQFKGAGAFADDGTVHYSTYIGCYTEGDEGPSIMSPGSIMIGGNIGAGVAGGPKNGVHITAVQGYALARGKGIQVTDDPNTQDIARTNIFMDVDNGFTVKIRNNGQVHWDADTLAGTAKIYGNIALNNSAFEFTGTNFNMQKFNWNETGNSPAVPIVSSRLGFRSVSNAERIRMLYADSVAPASVANFHGKGDFVLYNGSDTCIAGYRCTGTDWITIYSGNCGEKIGGSTTFTPTATGVANYASSANLKGFYQQHGNIVSYTISGTVTATAGAAAVLFDLSLPVASDFSNQQDAGGTGSLIYAGSNEIAIVLANTTDNRLAVSTSTIGGTNARNFVITGHYEIK